MTQLVHHLLSLPRICRHVLLAQLPIGVHALQKSSERGLQFDQIQCRVAILVEIRQHHLGKLPGPLVGVSSSHPGLPAAALNTACWCAAVLQLLTAMTLRVGGIGCQGQHRGKTQDQRDRRFHWITFSFLWAARRSKRSRHDTTPRRLCSGIGEDCPNGCQCMMSPPAPRHPHNLSEKDERHKQIQHKLTTYRVCCVTQPMPLGPSSTASAARSPAIVGVSGWPFQASS